MKPALDDLLMEMEKSKPNAKLNLLENGFILTFSDAWDDADSALEDVYFDDEEENGDERDSDSADNDEIN